MRMRYLGTLMLLASVAMLLFPVLWEKRSAPDMPPGAATAPQVTPGRSTLRQDDLLPPWRGPAEKDG